MVFSLKSPLWKHALTLVSRTGVLFERDPLLAAVRQMPLWLCCGFMTALYGLWSSKRRTIRAPLMVGFAIFTAGLGKLLSPSVSNR